MSKKTNRKIVVEGKEYIWNVSRVQDDVSTLSIFSKVTSEYIKIQPLPQFPVTPSLVEELIKKHFKEDDNVVS